MTLEEVIVRPAELTDAADLQANCLSMATLEAVQSQIEHDMRETTKGECVQLVAQVSERVVGHAELFRDQHPLRRHRAGLYSLVVCGDYHGQGIASRLVEAIRQRANEMDIVILETSCRAGTPAEEVYRRLGFVEYGRLPKGLSEPWGEQKVFDEVYFFMPTRRP